MILLKRRFFPWSVLMIFFLFGSIHMACGMSRPGKSLNVLFISIDTLRPDHLGCYGYKDIKTPHIDRLAKDGILFTNAYSPVPLTLPSHVTLMTGQDPILHGVRNNGTFMLSDSADTLAEVFKKSGYRTAAIVASYVLAAHFGLNQGFDLYDDHFFQNREEMSDYSENYRLGEEVTDVAKEWLGKNHQKPFFLWVHYFDPHTPYTPPSPFDTSYKDKPYDGEIAYTDQCLGDLLEEMRALSLLENTLIIFVGDHGEGLWEHNEQTHGLFIYDTTLKVPLIISCPGLLPKGDRVDALVGIIDLVPTILELLGIQSKKILVQGTSLVPFMTGKEKDIRRDLYCESLYPKLNFNWAPLEGIVTRDGWKYIHAPKPELFHLEKDPGEKTNLWSAHPQKAKSLQERFQNLKKDLLQQSESSKGAESIALSPEAKERLRSLGYIGFSGSSDEASEEHTGQELPDPKDEAHLLVLIDMARQMEAEGRIDQAIRQYEDVLEQDPENKMALFYAGLLYGNMGNTEKSLSTLQKLAEIEPENYDCKNALGLLYDRLGMPEKAIREYKAALQINPKIAYILHNLGKVYLNINELDLAAQEFQKMRSFTQDPIVISMAIGNLGGIDIRRGDLKQAVEKFKESIRLDSINRDAHISLADTYYHLGDIDESIHEWKTITDLWSDDYIAYYRVAQLYYEANKSDQAIPYLKKCLQIRPDFMDARMLLQNIYQGISFSRF